MRDGREQEISSFDLVVGDLLVVEGGDILPADGILVDGSTLRYLSSPRAVSISLLCSLDESHLTGESDEQEKSPVRQPVVFSGSKVNEGVGRVLVLAVGSRSKQGAIASLASGQALLPSDGSRQNASLRQTTVLTEKLERLAGDIGRFGLAAALITLVAMSGQFSYRMFFLEHRSWNWEFLEIYLRQLITSITILAFHLSITIFFDWRRASRSWQYRRDFPWHRPWLWHFLSSE